MTGQLTDRYLRAKHIAMRVLELGVSGRAAAIAQECGDDEAMAREVRWMVDAVESSHTATLPLQPGDTVDLSGHDAQANAPRRYRLVRRVGEGGMGVVYLAERDDADFVQQVALKVLNTGAMGSPTLLERFTRERQLLARLEHPGIARLLDGGVLSDGQPFLTMEYVEGERIDAWCERHGLQLRERIALFLKVCAAVDYAHRNLVIHRDLKPANILVDGQGQPKLLDFGIAQALDRSGAGSGREHQYLTPRYASPEQIRSGPVSMSSDIYALGLLLYALVANRPPPYAPGNEAAPPPPRPSRDAAPELPWRRRLAGDIDAVVARACALDPAQRYASAAALAEDLQRIGAHQPVRARRQSWPYVSGRLLRRHWSVFAATAAILLLGGAFTWRTVLAEREARKQVAITERVTDYLVSVFAASDSDVNQNLHHDLTAREVLDNGTARVHAELAGEPAVRARLLEAMGNAYRHMGLQGKAVPLLREAAGLDLGAEVNQPLAAARSLEALSNALSNGGFSSKDALAAARQSLALRERLSAAGSEDIANSWIVLSVALDRDGQYPEARQAAQTAYDMLLKLPAEQGRIAVALNNLGLIASHAGDQPAAKGYFGKALAIDRDRGELHTGGHLVRLGNYAHAVEGSGDFAAAIALDRQALALSDDLYGKESGSSVYYQTDLARMLNGQASYAEAQQHIDFALAAQARLGGEQAPRYASLLFQVANVRSALGHCAAALAAMRKVIEVRGKLLSADDLGLARAREVAATLLLDQGKADAEAAAWLDSAAASYRQHHSDPDLAYALVGQARLQYLRGDRAAATTLLARVDGLDAGHEFWPRVRAAALRATMALQQGDLAAALAGDELAWSILRDHLGAGHPQTARFGLLWAHDLRKAGQTGEADRLEKTLRPVFDRTFPADSQWRADLALR
ncbi:serine/threonine-protein kinase [Rhodanobacter sp. DHB23]|uniref:serine/threonine-protein kinase n=1 Tax=Rhodanobacter sp. DHB23 TaxID=2775923 RepID=UPI0017871BA1|nr:serine/threonine-protein kinase [Rhodanobacter sp. DHB23]MBD8873486.1 protein kinase [Rhodanobacter sp. DHB23]